MATETQRIAALEAKVKKISKSLGYKQIKYSASALTGVADCCYIFGINFNTGDIFYRDELGNWQPVPGNGGGGGSTNRFGIEDNLGVQFREMDMDGFIFNLINAESITLYSNAVNDYAGFSCQGTTNAVSSLFAGNINGQSSVDVNVDEIFFNTPFGSQTLAQGSGYTALTVNGEVADVFGNIVLDLGGGGAVPTLQQVAVAGPSTTIDLSLASINITGLSINGSTGTAGQILSTNGTIPSWVTNNNLHQTTTIGASTTNSIAIGTLSASTSKLDIANTNLGQISSSNSGINLKNLTLATALSQSQSSPPIEFSANQWDAFNGVNAPTKFKIYTKSAPFGISTIPGPGSAGTNTTFLSFESSDTGSLKVPLLLNSIGDVYFGNGIAMTGTRFLRATSTISYVANTSIATQHLFANQIQGLDPGIAIVKMSSGGSTSGLYSKVLETVGDLSVNVLNAYALGNVSIGPNFTPSVLAQLDVNSVGRGFLPPRLNNLQQDGIPQGLLSIAVTNGGSGYNIAPGVIIPASPGGGLQARAYSVLGTGGTANQVVSIVVDFRGSAYPSVPAISFNNVGTGGIGNPDGTGAAATATVNTIATPEGLMIYNTVIKKMRFYNGTAWETITSS